MLAKVVEFIERNGLVKAAGQKILVGVSGGPDSVALLHLLLSLRRQLKIKGLHVAHFNHRLRGQEASADAKFVQELSSAYGLPVTVGSFDVAWLAKKQGISVQAAGHQARSEFFERIAKAVGADLIATGHHADDQAETVLMRFLRGAGISGLSGISPRQGRYIRPFLNVRRREVERYCQENGLKTRVDPSNFKEIYFRNKVRLRLIPYLEEEYNEQIVDGLNRLADILRVEDEYLETVVHFVFSRLVLQEQGKIIVNKQGFLEQSKALQRRLIKNIYRELTGNDGFLGFEHINNVLEQIRTGRTGGVTELPRDIKVLNNYQQIVFSRQQKNQVAPYCYRVPVPGQVYIPEAQLRVTVELFENVEFSELAIPDDARQAWLDFDRLKFPLVLRSRLEGDRFQPLGMKGSKKLKDFFIDEKISVGLRGNIPLLAGDRDIYWVVGRRIGETVKITPRSKKAVYLTVHEIS